MVVAQAAVTEHQRVVRLHIFRVHLQDGLQRLYRLSVLLLEEENTADLIEVHTVARILGFHRA